jgi:hypothetical protein
MSDLEPLFIACVEKWRRVQVMDASTLPMKRRPFLIRIVYWCLTTGSSVMDGKSKQRFWQLRLSTAIVLLLVVAAWFGRIQPAVL